LDWYPIEEKLFVAMAIGPYVLAVPSDENILVVWNTGTNTFNRRKSNVSPTYRE
jgi:hypothetical protein